VAAGAKPEVSVVIPTRNGARRIGATLEALAHQRTTRGYEILVVDDVSDDGSPDEIERVAGVRVLRQAQAGPGAARNRGVREAAGEIILFTDDDCVPEPEWLERMCAPFADPSVAGTKGVYLTRQRELTARFVQQEYEEKYAVMAGAERINLVDTYAAGFRRQVFLDAGGYDETFAVPSVEDRDFSFKLWRAGHKLVFVPDARVYHTHADAFGKYVRKKYKNGYWGALSIRKNPSTMTSTSDTPKMQKAQVLLAAAAAVPGLGLPALGALLLSSLPLTLRCLRRDPAVGLLAPAFVLGRAAGLAAGLAVGVVAARTR